jgi:multimeric flavodoxin WrbA
MKVKILGMSGSVRKESGTEYAVKEALKAAEQVDADIETRYISLKRKNIRMCIHCDGCYKNQSRCVVRDDYREVEDQFLEADGYIMASPVYNMNVTPVMQAFMSRIRAVYLEYPGHFTRRVGGAIAVAGGRNGGQEMTILNIHNFYQTYEIICCGGSLFEPAGGMVWSVDGSPQGAKNDEEGIEGSRRLGQRIAQTAAFLKMGYEQFEKEGRSVKETKNWYVV